MATQCRILAEAELKAVGVQVERNNIEAGTRSEDSVPLETTPDMHRNAVNKKQDLLGEKKHIRCFRSLGRRRQRSRDDEAAAKNRKGWSRMNGSFFYLVKATLATNGPERDAEHVGSGT